MSNVCDYSAFYKTPVIQRRSLIQFICWNGQRESEIPPPVRHPIPFPLYFLVLELKLYLNDGQDSLAATCSGFNGLTWCHDDIVSLWLCHHVTSPLWVSLDPSQYQDFIFKFKTSKYLWVTWHSRLTWHTVTLGIHGYLAFSRIWHSVSLAFTTWRSIALAFSPLA